MKAVQSHSDLDVSHRPNASTGGHDAVGQVPCDFLRGSQIGPGALGYARGTPATAVDPPKKLRFFFEKT